MNLSKLFKRISIVAVCGFGLSVFTPAYAQAATPEQNAQKLVDALKVVTEVEDVSYLYAYMQSVKLTDTEYNKIVANAEQVANLLKGVSDPSQLTSANKAEALRLFTESSQLAHLTIAFVDNNGKAVDLSNWDLKNGLKLQVKDLNGNILATINPDKNDLNADVLAGKIAAIKTAVSAKVEIDKTGKFIPMPGAKLPNTASDLPLNIALGGLLVALGALSLKPAMKLARKMEQNEA